MKKSAGNKSSSGVSRGKTRKTDQAPKDLQGMAWRVDRLERQVRRLSELVREHAADADRLVRIVAEDREILRRALLRKASSALGVDTPLGL